MTASHDNLVIGVDAGGTKTTAWIAPLDAPPGDEPACAKPLAVGAASGGNMRAIGFEAAATAVREAIDSAFAAAGLSVQPVAGFCLSAAGAGRSAEQQQWQQWAEVQQVASQVLVTGDAAPILAAASADNVGIALISGTGSLAWARNSAGEIQRAGGWGYLFGDEGSGYAISIAGLKAAARAIDGRGEQTALVSAWLDRFGVSIGTDLIEAVYGSQLSRAAIAAHADVVFDVANAGDEVAIQITSDAARDLAEMVKCLAQRPGFLHDDFALGMAGGVLVKQPKFRIQVADLAGVEPGRVKLVETPVAGAVALARGLAAGSHQ